MTYPRFQRSRGFKFNRFASGSSLTLSATAITELATATNGPGSGGYDITLEAKADDVLWWGFNGQWAGENVAVGIEIFTMVSGSRTNPFGTGLSASLATTQGVLGWMGLPNITAFLAGEAPYKVQSADVVSGAVTMRPYFAGSAATAKTIYKTGDFPLFMWAKNLGPVSV